MFGKVKSEGWQVGGVVGRGGGGARLAPRIDWSNGACAAGMLQVTHSAVCLLGLTAPPPPPSPQAAAPPFLLVLYIFSSLLNHRSDTPAAVGF